MRESKKRERLRLALPTLSSIDLREPTELDQSRLLRMEFPTQSSPTATGEYATESEVIREGLRTLLARDRAVEGWLREQVAPTYGALKADPSRAFPAGDVRATLSAEHKKVAKKG